MNVCFYIEYSINHRGLKESETKIFCLFQHDVTGSSDEHIYAILLMSAPVTLKSWITPANEWLPVQDSASLLASDNDDKEAHIRTHKREDKVHKHVARLMKKNTRG